MILKLVIKFDTKEEYSSSQKDLITCVQDFLKTTDIKAQVTHVEGILEVPPYGTNKNS